MFPEMSYGRDVWNLHLRGSDISEVRFNPPLLLSAAIRSCTFEGVGFGEADFRKVIVVDSAFRDCQLAGFLTDVAFERVGFEDCTFSDCFLKNVRMIESHLHGVRFKDASWSGGTIRATEIEGQMHNANWRNLTFDRVDLSAFRMLRTAMVGWVGTVQLPEYADCFVVRVEALQTALPSIKSRISSGSFASFQAIADSETGGGDPIVVDDEYLRWGPSPRVGEISAPERQAILRALYPYRLRTLQP